MRRSWFLFAFGFGPSAWARPGLAPVTTTTEDTRASTIGLKYAALVSDSGTGHTASYLSNFSSTTSKVSAQFGLHFLTFDDTDRGRLWGFSGSSMTVFSIPVGARFDNGVPRFAVQLSPGLLPVVAIGRRHVEVDIPLVLRLGVPVSPVPSVTLTPWVEGGASLSFDGAVTDAAFEQGEAAAHGELPGEDDDIPATLGDVIQYDMGLRGFARGGLDLSFHVGRVDLNLHVSASTLDAGPQLTWLVHGGAGLRIRWDRVVPSVLPPAPCEPVPTLPAPAPSSSVDPPPAHPTSPGPDEILDETEDPAGPGAAVPP